MNLVERAKNVILQPTQEWKVIDAEPQTVQGLYTQYVMILAAIPAVCGFVGLSLIGIGVFGATYRVPIAAGVAHMVVSYLLSLGCVYVLALIIDALAPSFGAQKNFMQALKVAAFSPTAAWLAGVFSIIPSLGIIGALLSLYSLYLLYVGLPTLMKPPADKAIPYLTVVIIATIVIFVVIAAIVGLTMPGPVRGF
ncbi:MAG: Yip1 family protein [Usitatibacter sp.]